MYVGYLSYSKDAPVLMQTQKISRTGRLMGYPVRLLRSI